ncbi:helix-turn-helix domain-containing protein [Myroides sp. LoEW2-1]|uniref:helix-turn-helix domain-containing protein n=1 Tax=Myroides sp. LoEW2-1 TaxID=2683192 RepID=UPI0013290545|nr:helix-turn-helix transcriptional regulator [Myroides sp. LoEW2-1]MVX35890.1 helix-turn-helix domain-containing protein [Myroides sp. LoEW2-1]
MTPVDNINNYSIKELLDILGRDYQESGIYIDFHSSFSENPLKYPYRSNNFTLLLINQGQINLEINLIKYTLLENTITIIPPQMVIHFRQFSDNINFTAISFDKSFAFENTHSQNEKSTFILLAPNTVNKLSLNQEQKNNIHNLCTLIDRKNNQKSHLTNRQVAIKHLFSLLLLELLDTSQYNYNTLKRNLSRKEILTIKFLELLQKHFKTERLIGYYASSLCVSESYLSKVVKEITSKTIGQIIDDAIIVEAQLLLSNTSMSISEVSDILQFNSTSFFGKFFKRKVGCSPRLYRKGLL